MAVHSGVAVYPSFSLCSHAPGNEGSRLFSSVPAATAGQVPSKICRGRGDFRAKHCNVTVAYVTPIMAKLTGCQQVRDCRGRWGSPASCHVEDSFRRGRRGHKVGATAPQSATEMQFHHHVTLEVAAPPDIVWNLWVDLKSAPHWMRWIQRVEILEENESSSNVIEGGVIMPREPTAAPTVREKTEGRRMEIESSSIQTRSSEGRSGQDEISDTKHERILGKERIQERREDTSEAVLRDTEVYDQQSGESNELNESRQAGEGAGEEGEVKREPRLNSLSRWVCNTAGFEVSWTARIECIEVQPPVRVIRWATVQGLRSKGEVRFTESVGSGTCVELKIEHSLPPALAKVMSQHALSSLIEATLKSDLERFEQYALSTASSKT